MFNSTVIDVALGLVFIYLVLALVCTSFNEGIAQFLSLRAETLWTGIQGMFGKDGGPIADALYDHPVIQSLIPKKKDGSGVASTGLPSYIPDHLFSLALSDVLTSPKIEGSPVYESVQASLNADRHSVLTDDARAILRPIVAGANHKLDGERKSIEAWYNETMARVSGWYKRRIQTITFCVACLLVFIANADTLMLTQRLWAAPTVRQSLVSSAGKLAPQDQTGQQSAITAQPTTSPEQEKAAEAAIAPLIGWSGPINWTSSDYKADDPRRFPQGWDWFYKVFGLLITVYAVSLGAPFWFDLLQKIMQIRSSGNAPGEKQPGPGGLTPGRIASGDSPPQRPAPKAPAPNPSAQAVSPGPEHTPPEKKSQEEAAQPERQSSPTDGKPQDQASEPDGAAGASEETPNPLPKKRRRVKLPPGTQDSNLS